MSISVAIKTALEQINFVEWLHLFKMARDQVGRVTGGNFNVTSKGTDRVPEGVQDKEYKDYADERIILPLITLMRNKRDRQAITDMLKDLSLYEQNGFRQVISGCSSGRSIFIEIHPEGESQQDDKGKKSKTFKSDPDFTVDDLRVKVLTKIAQMIQDENIGLEQTKVILRSIGTLPGKSTWEVVQGKMIELYNSEEWRKEMSDTTERLSFINYILILLIAFMIFIILGQMVFLWNPWLCFGLFIAIVAFTTFL